MHFSLFIFLNKSDYIYKAVGLIVIVAFIG